MQFNSIEDLVSFVTMSKLPAWQKKLFKKFSESIRTHSQGWIFYKLDRLFPNEHIESKYHRILSFESVTEASFGRAANNVNRIFKNSSYQVEASEKTLEVTNAHTFEGTNFFTWFLDQWTKWALKEDPNSRFVVYPPDYVNKYNRPPVAFVGSEWINVLNDECFAFTSVEESDSVIELEEIKVATHTFYDQSIDMVNSRRVIDVERARENTYTPRVVQKITRFVFHVFFSNGSFYRISQNKANGESFEVEEFNFSTEFLPVMDVGGDPDRFGINKSFLQPFVTFGNLALLQHSQHTAVNFTFSFPRMSEIETPCEAPGCNSGFIETEDLKTYPDGRRPCMLCGGTGFRAPQSPYKIYKKRLDPNGMQSDLKYLETPDVQYYTPDTAILDYSKSEWKDYLESAEQAVYIQQRVKTGHVESAKSKEIDRDDLYAFLSRVGQVYFSRLRFALQCFENYYVNNPTWVVVENPYSYAILSEGEAFDALKDILSSNVPIMLKANQVESFITKFVSQSSPLRKFIDVLKLVDPLFYYPYLEVTAYKASGVVNSEQLSIHVFAFPILQQMYFKDKNLFSSETQTIADNLLKELEKFKPQPADLKSNLLNQFNQQQQAITTQEQKLQNAE